MEFGHFGDGGMQRNVNGNNATGPSVPQHAETRPDGANVNGGSANPPNTSGNGNDTSSGEPVFMHTMEHHGVFCDACEGRIRGFRYKCLQCSDFDLCTACERRGQHPGHVMIRIAFPEQTGDAIRRYFNTPEPSHRAFGHGMFQSQFPQSGRRHCHFRERAPRESEGESGEEKGQSAGCPYGLGRKGMKKWAKCMKKMAYQQRRSAEDYARAFAAGAPGNSASFGPTPTSGNGNEGLGTTNPANGQFDFTAAASQIQEFLNAFGIPIDVVELYDSYGNSGNPRNGEAENPPTTAATATTTASSATVTSDPDVTSRSANVSNTAELANQTPSIPNTNTVGTETIINEGTQPTTLAANLQQMHINPNATGTPSAPLAENNSLSQPGAMEVDPDAGWMIVEPGSNSFDSNMTVHIPIQRESVNSTPISSGPTSMNGQGAVPENQGLSSARPTETATPRAPNTGMYPVLNPQLQQLLSGVSQAMNSVVRNIPIVTNPSGPAGATAAELNGPSSIPEMDTKCATTLNQLLAMGFSNHDQWLSRLVIAKKGDLEAVLNALFPGGSA